MPEHLRYAKHGQAANAELCHPALQGGEKKRGTEDEMVKDITDSMDVDVSKL